VALSIDWPLHVIAMDGISGWDHWMGSPWTYLWVPMNSKCSSDNMEVIMVYLYSVDYDHDGLRDNTMADGVQQAICAHARQGPFPGLVDVVRGRDSSVVHEVHHVPTCPVWYRGISHMDACLVSASNASYGGVSSKCINASYGCMLSKCINASYGGMLSECINEWI
jgi:hypothetical protein